ncbi:MAG: AsmA family protein [Gammaproteobacteria bacterium]|nr:AsmA family protein [Gammaproteobacteria bacterium]
MSGIIKKIFKLVAYLLLVLVVFVATAAGVFIATFDANAYKQDLQDLVRQQTGRDLQFFGDVGLTIYPALGMKLGALSFSNASGFGTQPMVKVNQVSISVEVASLLAFKPEVAQLILRDLEVNLQKNSSGTSNWDDLLKQETSSSSTSSSTPATSDGETIKISGAFGGLNIENAALLWKDEQAGVEHRVSDLDLTTSRITANAPFSVKMGVVVQTDKEADPLTIGFASESVAVGLNANTIKMQSLQLGVNDLLFRGQIDVHDYTQPSVSFSLAADTLDVDALLGTPPSGSQPAEGGPQPVKTGSAEDVEIKLPMELLRSLQIDGAITIARLKLQNLWMEQVSLGVNAKDGVIDLKPMQLTLYDGSFDGAIQVNARGKKPEYRVSKTLKSVQVGKLLSDFSGEDTISGAMNASVNVATSGEWLSALKKNSTGDMSLKFTDGALKGFNLRHLIDNAKARLRGQAMPDAGAQTTDFSSLSLTGKIERGVFSSNDLNLQAPALRVSGAGKANLNSDSLNYLVKAKLVGSLQGQQGDSSDELSGLLIPVRIKGPFTDPDIDVQLDEMLKAHNAQKIAAEKAKLKAEIEAEKAALQKQIKAEKVALEAAKQKELEKQKAVLKAKKAAAKAKAEKAAKDKLMKLLD